MLCVYLGVAYAIRFSLIWLLRGILCRQSHSRDIALTNAAGVGLMGLMM